MSFTRISISLIVSIVLLRAAVAEDAWHTTRELSAPEAIQAAAADKKFVYAIASRKIAKYDRATGKRVAVSTGKATHLNSGFLWEGKLLSAHSNYPKTPEQSEIKVLDPKSMRLSTFKAFGDAGGSLTWVVRYDDHWWCNFARYGEKNAETFFVKFDDDWRELDRWTYPKAVIKQLGRYSLSGGLWYKDELLVTGHDEQEFYRLRLPKTGNVLEYLGKQPVPFTGQGFAHDPDSGGLVGISRARRRVIFVKRGTSHSSKETAMPSRGICAHRGASETHPENTPAAFREAIRLGAQMIEFDVALSKDGELVLMHDDTIDRTTNGQGAVSNWTLAKLKQLDAGSWKNTKFKGERIPTLDEALAIMPENIWLNVHLKGDVDLAKKVTARIVANDRLHQSFLACGAKAAEAAKGIDARIKICNMERQGNSLTYVNETIAMKADFIQLYGGSSVDPAHTKLLTQHGIRINFCCANDAAFVSRLFQSGTQFPLVDRLEPMLEVADKMGIERLKPVYRSPKRSITHGPFVGHITSNSALVWARYSTPGEYRLTATSDAGDEVRTKAESLTKNDGCVVFKLKSLRPATRYRYTIEFVDDRLVEGEDYHFTTASKQQAGIVRLGFASCAKEDEGTAAVWGQMQKADPHAVVLLGDTPYIDSTDVAVQRQRHRAFAAATGFKDLVRNRSLYATWDDHDFGRNDTDGNLKGKENSRRVFMEYRANPSYGDGKTGIYTKFRRGGVEVFLLDTRYFAATEPSQFDKSRQTLLGAQQWNWLHRELKASTAPFKVLACGMIWNRAVRSGKKDHWGTYPHERNALFEFIGKEKISGVILVGGDIHRTRVLRHKTTNQVGYDIPELITSPAHAGVIANANVPHPALVHDSGEPNSFLLMTINTKNDSATLNANFLNKDGRTFFKTEFTERDLQ